MIMTRYRYVPFCMQTIVWIDHAAREGFVPFRARAVRKALESHGWQVQLDTVWWFSWLANRRRNRDIATSDITLRS